MPAERRLAWVAGLAAGIGFVLGLMGPAWQVALEPAQVVAGLVDYPAGNPFYVYQTKLWTLWHHLGALGLWLGATERALSFLLCGLAGALTCAAFALGTYALAKEAAPALVAPVLLIYLMPASWGFHYPIMLLGSQHTYGMTGLSFVVLALALLANGARRTGGVLLGLAPAVHPSLGIWAWVVLGLAVLWDRRGLWPWIASARPYVIAGAAASVVSFGVQVLFVTDVPPLAADERARYLAAFIRNWDTHRVPLDYGSANLRMVGASFAAALAWLRFRAGDPPAPGDLVLRVQVLAAGIGLLASVWLLLPTENVPALVQLLMPVRTLNVASALVLPLLLGLLWRCRGGWIAPVAVAIGIAVLYRAEADTVTILGASCLLLLVATEIAARRLAPIAFAAGVFLLWLGACLTLGAATVRGLALLATGLTLVAIVETRTRSRSASLPAPTRTDAPWQGAALLLRPAAWILLAALLFLSSGWGLQVWRARARILRDRTNDPLWAEAARAPDLLLPGPGLFLVQLRTRRPVLLDPMALDMLPYAIEGAPAAARILTEAYGVDFFDPPAATRNLGIINPEVLERVWAERSAETWRAVKREFGVSSVLTLPGWRLQLPVAAASDEATLYRIP